MRVWHMVSVRTIRVHECVSPCTEQGFVILPSDFLSFSPVGTLKWKRQLHSSQLIGEKKLQKENYRRGRQTKKGGNNAKTGIKQSSGHSSGFGRHEPHDWSSLKFY